MSLFSNLPNFEYNGKDLGGAVSFYNARAKDVYTLISSIEPNGPLVTKTELSQLGYTNYLSSTNRCGYWFHNALPITVNNHATLLFKMAVIEGLSPETREKHNIKYTAPLGTSIGSLIYTEDKYSKNKKIGSNTVSRTDRLEAYAEYKPKTNSYSLRFQGSKDGHLVYSKQLRISHKNHNMTYLALHQHGPSGLDKHLSCHVKGRDLTPYYLTNYATSESVLISEWEVHHVLCKQNSSLLKTTEPGDLLAKTKFEEFSHNQHLELLGCITLSVDAHQAIHDSSTYDGIDFWLLRHKNLECVSLPYHFMSEANYLETLGWLDTHTNNFCINSAPSYNEFVAKHSIMPMISS